VSLCPSRVSKSRSSLEKCLRCTAAGKEANQAAVAGVTGRIGRCLFAAGHFGNQFRFNGGTPRAALSRGLDNHGAGCQSVGPPLRERRKGRCGGGDDGELPSCANLKRSKLLKYWCNRETC